MKPLIFTSLNEFGTLSKFFVFDRSQIVAIESHPDSNYFKAILILTNGKEVQIRETAEEVLEIIDAAWACAV